MWEIPCYYYFSFTDVFYFWVYFLLLILCSLSPLDLWASNQNLIHEVSSLDLWVNLAGRNSQFVESWKFKFFLSIHHPFILKIYSKYIIMLLNWFWWYSRDPWIQKLWIHSTQVVFFLSIYVRNSMLLLFFFHWYFFIFVFIFSY